MSNSLTIVHRPTGIDHPYEPFFDERRPRDPSGGDMVVLGFLTRPGLVSESTRVEWSRNGKLQTTIYARAMDRNEVEDRWLVELGVVEAGDQVKYRICVKGQDGSEIATPQHSFDTRSWHIAAKATPIASTADLNCFALTNTHGEAGPNLIVSPEVDGNGMAFWLEPARFERGSEFVFGDGANHVSPAGEILLDRRSCDPLPVTIRWQEEAGRITAGELTGPLGRDEILTGFGERFDSLNQHSRALDVVVYEQYKNQGNRTYLPIPFFLSNEGYGLLVGGTTKVSYDIGKTVPDRWRCLAEVPASGTIEFRSFSGEPDAIVRALTAQTGRPDPLPLWAYGVWMSSNEWNTQARVEREVAKTQHHGIPATVVVIEAWSDETTFYIWNGASYEPRSGDHVPQLSDFTFPDNGPWPDPVGMTKDLHDAGIRLVLWQIPVLKHLEESHPQQDADADHAVQNQFVLQNEDGTPFRNPFFWFKDGLIPDFTSKAATEWWLSKRAYLLDEMGIDGFKTDGSEHLAGRGLRASDGRRGDELVSAYPNLYIDASYKFAKAHRNGDALTFSRAGHTGAGASPAHWAGDENSTWEAYRRSIVAGLTAGLSGVIFWGWDIAGFSDALPSAELYLRSTAMATFCPIMQYHSEYNPPGEPSRDRTPWNIAAHTGDDRAISLFRYFARVRMNLLPYIAAEAEFAVKNGAPLMRPLLLDFPDDPECWQISDQYLFGRSLLIAPIVEEDATTRTLYLPAGVWVDFWQGTVHMGAQWITVDAPWDSIPVFARGGTVIPLRLGEAKKLGDDTGNGLSLTDGLTYWRAAATNHIQRTSRVQPSTMKRSSVVNLWDRSIEVIRENQKSNGAYIASPNFPTYNYSWFRDGSYIAYAMDRAGEPESATRFFDWAVWAIGQRIDPAERAIATALSGTAPDDADLLDTRYTVDGQPGEMQWFNNQLDGFGTLLWAMNQHREITNAEQPGWRTGVDLLARYLAALWTFPCSDCWEEFPDKIHVASLSAIFGGLTAAASMLSEPRFNDEAERIREFVVANGVKNGALVKFIGTGWVDASLIHAATPYRLLDVNDPIMVQTVARLESDLIVNGGGLHRYVEDNYYGGGEWILLTAYLAWYYVERGDLERALELRSWIERQANVRGDLPEQVADHMLIPERLPAWIAQWGPVATPLVWSHAAYLTLVSAMNERAGA